MNIYFFWRSKQIALDIKEQLTNLVNVCVCVCVGGVGTELRIGNQYLLSPYYVPGVG